jgi:hypothetical protein
MKRSSVWFFVAMGMLIVFSLGALGALGWSEASIEAQVGELGKKLHQSTVDQIRSDDRLRSSVDSLEPLRLDARGRPYPIFPSAPSAIPTPTYPISIDIPRRTVVVGSLGVLGLMLLGGFVSVTILKANLDAALADLRRATADLRGDRS